VNIEEIPIVFSCQKNDLIGIVHKSVGYSSIGVLLVVGGPQYRVGSHRQFILLARMLAANGVHVLRFDYRGMGDSQGDVRSFADVDEDIKSALDAFYQYCTDMQGVAIWGLCDAASAALFYAYQDERVKGLILLNPWVFTAQGSAMTYLKHYYLQRIMSPDLWRKVFLLQFDYRQSFASLYSFIRKVVKSENGQLSIDDNHKRVDRDLSLPVRMRECLQRFKYPVLIILSGRDITADEFRETIKSDPGWQDLFNDKRIKRVEMPDADHTFSSAKWRDKVSESTLTWVKNL
jgi:exosortase A-associated hydrolase 1